MKQIIVTPREMNFLSYLSFFILIILTVIIQYIKSYYIIIDISLTFIISPIILMMFHETMHYFGYLFFANLKIEQLILRPIKPYPIPYISTLQTMQCKIYAYILLLPTIVLSLFTFTLAMLIPNVLYSYMFAISVGMASGDLLLAIRLLKLDKPSIIQTCEEGWGVYLLDSFI